MNTDKRRRAVGLLAAALGWPVRRSGLSAAARSDTSRASPTTCPSRRPARLRLRDGDQPETRDVVSGDYRFAGDGSTIAQTAAQFTHNMNERGWTLDRIDQSTDKAALDFWKEPHGRLEGRASAS